MKRLLLIATIMISLPFILNGQMFSGNWVYANKTDPFSGDYKIASTSGTFDEFPYENPQFKIWINKGDSIPEMCFAKVPYAGCEGKKVKIKFDNKITIYEMVANESADAESWFIEPYGYSFTEDFFKSIKSSNTMYIRLSSDCEQSYDCSFSLVGLTTAINFLKIPSVKLNIL